MKTQKLMNTQPPKIFIANDHAGLYMKELIIKWLITKNIKTSDLGCNSENPVDYPLYAHKLSKEIIKHPDTTGILICGSGIGMAMTANKHKELRATQCYTHNTHT